MLKNLLVIIGFSLIPMKSHADLSQYAITTLSSAEVLVQNISHQKLGPPHLSDAYVESEKDNYTSNLQSHITNVKRDLQTLDRLKQEIDINKKAITDLQKRETTRWYHHVYLPESTELKTLRSDLFSRNQLRVILEKNIQSELQAMQATEISLKKALKSSQNPKAQLSSRIFKAISELPRDALGVINQYTQGVLNCGSSVKRLIYRIWKSRSALNLKNANERTPLMEAAARGQLEIVLKLLQTGEVIVDATDTNGSTAALLAAEAGHIQIVSLLEKYSSDLSKKNKNGKNAKSILPLRSEEQSTWKSLDKFLSTRGNQNLTQLDQLNFDQLSRIPMNLISKSDLQNLRLMAPVSRTSNGTPFHYASKRGDLREVNKLIKKGKYAIDDEDSSGNSALMVAVLNGHFEVAKRLILAGARLDTLNSDKKSFKDLLRSELNLREELKNEKLTSQAVRLLFEREDIPRPSDLKITEVPNASGLGRTAGQLFLLKNQKGKLIYVVKKTIDKTNEAACQEEAENLQELYSGDDETSTSRRRRLGMSGVSHLAVAHHPDSPKRAPILRKAALPRIAQLEKAIFYKTPLGKNECVLILHGAQGLGLNTIAKKGSFAETQEAYAQVGESLGAFHASSIKSVSKKNQKLPSFAKLETDIHSDLHWGNLFYDAIKKQVSFIDNEGIQHGSPHRDITTVLRGITQVSEVAQEAYVEGLSKLPLLGKDPLVREELLKSQALHLHRPICAMENFEKTYVNSYPGAYRDEVRKGITSYRFRALQACQKKFDAYDAEIQKHYCQPDCAKLSPGLVFVKNLNRAYSQ